MFVGVFQTGRALFLCNQLMTSVSDAAALGAKLDYDMAKVDVTPSPATGVPQDVTVTITGYTIDALFTTFNLTNKQRATALDYGQISCSSC